MNTSDIDLMLSEKGNPCISMIIPTHRYTRDRMQNPELIEKAIQKARKLLADSTWPKEKIRQLENKFELILQRIDLIRLQEGLAIFISPNTLKVHLLPFPVKEKVVVGQKFEMRNLFYFAQFLQPYYLLVVSKKRIRLLKGTGGDLQELTNDDFPRQYVEEYEYAPPSIGSSSSAGLKAFERDKSIVQETRLKSFLRRADQILNKYLKEDTLLFVAGVEEELVSFEQVSHHLNHLAGRIPGNYDFNAIHPLAEIAWKKMKEVVRASNKELLMELQEEIGTKMAAVGIRNVWHAAMEGKGLALLLEKDYEVIAYRNREDKSEIFLTAAGEKSEIVVDAAGELIEMVREKGGKVVILENGELEEYQNIAMILRY
ncbi:MAG: hypothetical protein WEB30_04405 [Cyclobacteriaceae bacterium]